MEHLLIQLVIEILRCFGHSACLQGSKIGIGVSDGKHLLVPGLMLNGHGNRPI